MIINFYGIITLALIMLPNIVYFQRKKNDGTETVHQSGFRERNYRLKRQATGDESRDYVRQSTSVEIIESIGRYGCIFLMMINPGLYEYGFLSSIAEIVYYVLSAVLIVSYFMFWILLFKCDKKTYRIMLAVIPNLIFAANGILMYNPLLLVMTAIFAASHIYLTAKPTSAS